MKWKSLSCVQLFVTSWAVAFQAPLSMEFSRPEYWSRGIFPAQGLNPGLPHCRWFLNHLSHQGSLRILEWVAYPFSKGSSRSRNRTRVSCIAGEFFTSWATTEAPKAILKIWCQLMYSFSNTSLWLHAFALIFVSMSCFPLNGKGLKISYTEWLSFSLCQLKVWIVLKTQRLHACDHMVRKQIFKCTYTEYF